MSPFQKPLGLREPGKAERALSKSSEAASQETYPRPRSLHFRRVETVSLAPIEYFRIFAPASSSLAATLLVLFGAMAVELIGGEPPARMHPVVWMGKLTSACMRFAPRVGRRRQFAFGWALVLASSLLFAAGWGALSWFVRELPLVRLVLAAVISSTTFAFRELGNAAKQMQRALGMDDDLATARGQLSALCSRDASALEEKQLAAATVESVAENSSDSFVAPLFYYACFGVVGAVVYRVVNTLDAMVGYRGRYEYLGKAAARADDLLNWIPARITAALLLISGWLSGHSLRAGWSVLRRDGRTTQSPNAGLPMATMAGLLGVALEKPGHYNLGDPHVQVARHHISASWSVVRWCFALCLLMTAVLAGVRHVLF